MGTLCLLVAFFVKSLHSPVLVELRISSLNNVRSLLSDHVHSVLNATVGNDWDHRGVDYPQVLGAVDPELSINNTLLDALRKTGGTARIYKL